jgi:predicted aconitase
VYLTREEERIYDGEYGWAKQVCMRILVKLGELFNASRLIPIEAAHVSGVSYKTLGDAPTDFLEALANSGEKTVVEATLNPQGTGSIPPSWKASGKPCEKPVEALLDIRENGL